MSAVKTRPELWRRVVEEVKRESIGGTRAGQWSARKAQIAVSRYKSRGGHYVGPKSESNSLVRWTRQRWHTRSGRPSHLTGERYLPEKAIVALSPREYEIATEIKRRDTRAGRQFSRMPRSIARKVRTWRIQR